MKNRLLIFASLAPLSAGLLAIEACTLDRAGSCTDPLRCADTGQVNNDPPEPSVVSEGPGAKSCSTDVECDDGDPCTTDTCGVGACNHASVSDGEPVGGTECLPVVCQEGVATPSPAPAGEPCEGGGACDGAGACLLPLGGGCDDDAQCGSGYCVEGVCCRFACDDECEMCNPVTFSSCILHLEEEQDPDCADNTVCRGDNQCTLVEGESCTSDDDCFSQNCDQSGGDGVCQPT